MSSISRLSPAPGERPLRLEIARIALGFVLAATGTMVGGLGCVFTPPPPLPEELEAQAAAKAQAAAAAAARAKETGEAVAGNGETGEAEGGAEGGAASSGADAVLAANKDNGDPVDGFFTLEAALAGVEGEGKLMAEIVTPRGSIRCELFEEVAPITIANFVGLARGVRPFKNLETGEWAAGPYYDNTIFHRVIPGFVIQGGDPTGTGTGSPGYTILDELNPAYNHDSAGILSMANRGPNTGGSQFFITLGPTPSLDGKHTVFGRCDEVGTQLADDISIAPRDAADRPEQQERLERINIYRE